MTARPWRTNLAAVPQAWRLPLTALALSWLALIVALAGDWRAMAGQWWDISTYNHILLVPAIVAWLVAQRSGELARLTPRAWWPGLVLFAGACLLWALGSFAGLSLARQLGAVVMLQAATVTLLGPRVVAGLIFPLAYMLFLVPAGEELVPLLQLATAKMTMTLLALSGTPALMEGVFITTPAGYFKIAEACSGIKFLIAMSAFAVLAANLCFRAWPRRVAFVVGATAAAVLANGVRAWGTIVIAEAHGIEFASGFDHVFYGWIFFALVIALVLGIAWRWFDRRADEPQIDGAWLAASPLLARLERARISPFVALAVIGAMTLAGLSWSAAGDRLRAPLPPRIDLPSVPGWHRVDYKPMVWWEPRHKGAEHRLLGRYGDRDGETVDVSYALYSSQSDGREAGGFGEGAVPLDGKWAWARPEAPLAGAMAERIEAPGPVERVAFTWYRTDGLTTGSNLELKLANIADKLLLRRRATAVLIVSAEERPGAPAREAVERFLSATGAPGAWMDRVASSR